MDVSLVYTDVYFFVNIFRETQKNCLTGWHVTVVYSTVVMGLAMGEKQGGGGGRALSEQ